MALKQAFKNGLASSWISCSATFQSIFDQLFVPWEEILQHLLCIYQELVAEKVQLLDIRLFYWNFVAFEHCKRLILQVEEL